MTYPHSRTNRKHLPAALLLSLGAVIAWLSILLPGDMSLAQTSLCQAVYADGEPMPQYNGYVKMDIDGKQVVFSDVPAWFWYSRWVAGAIRNGIASGYKDKAGNFTGRFGTDNPVTIAEMTKMALLASGQREGKGTPYNQSAKNQWSAVYIAEAERLRWKFFTADVNVNRPATRAEVVQIVLDAIGEEPQGKAVYSDVTVNHPYTGAIARATQLKIVSGDDGAKTFRPNAPINRAEVAKILGAEAVLLSCRRNNGMWNVAAGGSALPQTTANGAPATTAGNSNGQTHTHAAAPASGNTGNTGTQGNNTPVQSPSETTIPPPPSGSSQTPPPPGQSQTPPPPTPGAAPDACTQDFPQSRLPASRPASGHHVTERKGVPGETRTQIYVRHDTAGAEYIPDCATAPTHTAVTDGSWNSATTWNTGTVPGANDTALIPAGKSVTMAGTIAARCVHAKGGNLALDPTKDVALTVSDMILITEGGKFSSTPASCVRHSVTFNGSLDIPNDPGQFGLGLVGVDANIDVNGKAPAIKFTALSGKVNAGSRTVRTAETTGWRVGDSVILSGGEFVSSNNAQGFPYDGGGARNVRATHETATITAISGTDITLDKSLSKSKEEYIANVSRNVTFSSPASSTPGHILFTGDSLVYFSNASMENLGRTGNEFINNIARDGSGRATSVGTNQQGRYPLHLHHLSQPYQADGNVLVNTRNNPRYQVSVHASHGTVSDNVFYGKAGAQLVFENGFETGLAKHNLTMQDLGGVDIYTSGIDTDETRADRLGVGSYSDHGFNGYGISTTSPYMAFENNVITGAVRHGGMKYMSFADYQNVAFPMIPGAPFSGQKIPLGQPVAKHEGTTILAYGFEKGWSRAFGGFVWFAKGWTGPYMFKNMTVKRGGVVAASYSFTPVTFDGLVLDGEHTTVQPAVSTTGNAGMKIINSRILNFPVGWVPDRSGDSVENTHFANIRDDIRVLIGDGDNAGAHLPGNPRRILIKNVTFGSPTFTHPSDPQKTNIAMRADVLSATQAEPNPAWILLPYITDCDGPDSDMTFADFGQLDRLLYAHARVQVLNYNNTGESFFVHFKEQADDHRFPCLDATNREMMEGTATSPLATGIVGRAMNNFMVTDKQQRPGILGYVSPIVPERFTFRPGDLWYINYAASQQQMDAYRITWCASCMIANTGEVTPGIMGTRPDAIDWHPGMNRITVDIPVQDGYPPQATIFLPNRMP